MKRRNYSKKYNGGSLLVEVIVVAAIITVSVLAASAVAQKSIYVSRQSVHQAQASFLLEEGAEATRIVRDNAWANLSGLTVDTDYYPTFSGGTWSLSSTPNQVDIFTRKVVVSSAYRDGSHNLATSGTIDNQTRLVTVTVTWAEGGQTISKTLQFYLSDIFS